VYALMPEYILVNNNGAPVSWDLLYQVVAFAIFDLICRNRQFQGCSNLNESRYFSTCSVTLV
jgi:hypothetical protein